MGVPSICVALRVHSVFQNEFAILQNYVSLDIT
jgi:hypothetical protein